MGLTGAGGALISIPLFINLLTLTLKEATVLSLIAVLLGTSINLFGQYTKVNTKIALPLTVAGILSNATTLFLKPMTPDLIVAILLILVACYSLWSIWIKNKSYAPIENKPSLFKALVAGILLGTLTTLTGLGGGVVLVPLLIRFFGKSYQEALPTSLAAVLIISLSSFLLQAKGVLELISLEQIFFMALGTVIAYFSLWLGLSKMKDATIELLRKIVFSLVTLYSVTSVINKVI